MPWEEREGSLFVDDPDGRPVQVMPYRAPAARGRPLAPARPALHDACTSAAPRKLGHVNCLTGDIQAGFRFYTEVLGMRLSDWLGEAGVWFHINSDHHVMALVDLGYAHFHHLAFETVDIGKMRDMLDHVARHGRWLGWGPTRHGIAGNIASYVRIVEEECFVELYCDMEQLQDDHVPRVYPDDRYSSNTWGPLPPRSYFRFDPVAIEYERESLRDARARPAAGARPARDGRSPATRSRARPAGRASIVPYPPWHYVGDFLVVEYWADPEKAVSVLPEGLDPHPDPGRCAAVFADWQSCSESGGELIDPSRSQYKEVFLVVNALLDGEEVTTCPFIWVDRDFALTRGWLQGFPKKLGSIWITRTFGLESPADPGVEAGRDVRRHLRRLRAAGRRGDGHARAALGGRADPQRPADRQRAPLPRLEAGRHDDPAVHELARSRSRDRVLSPCGREARRSSSSALRTRSTTCSLPCGSARASGSPSATRSTTRRS